MASEMPKLQRTRNYAKFSMTKENREVNLLTLRPEHKLLRELMQEHGFVPAYPIHVRVENGGLAVVDGQHRLAFAKEFGLDVWYVVDSTRVDIADINRSQAGWNTIDYAKKWAALGRDEYRKAIDFSEVYHLPIAVSFSMLAGTQVFYNIRKAFHDGTYKTSAINNAYRVGECFNAICKATKGMRNAQLANALWACTFVDYFDESRLIEAVQKRPGMLSRQGTRDGFLQMIEEIYNFARKVRVPLKFDAEQAMRARDPSKGANAKGSP